VFLSDTAIKRPVLTTVIIASIIVFGVVSFGSIGIDLFPRIEFPVVTILSVLPAADPETVETTVTDVIEEAVATVSGIKHLRSTSADSISQVVVEFELDKPVDVAYQEILAKLGTVRSELPDDLEDPIVEKFDIDAAPIMAVVISGDMSIRELTRLADRTVKERLQRVPNVGQAKLVGGRERQIWIWLDRGKLEGYGLAVQDVESALRSAHIEYPGGRVETGPREYAVKTKAEFESAEEFADMVVAYRGGAPVRTRDLGWVEDGLEDERSLARLDGQRAISILVRRQSGTNTVAVAQGVKAEVERLREELAPQGVSLEIAQDLSVFIEHSIAEVQFHLAFGGLLAVLIVWLFLRDFRITLISAIAIPTSVIGTFTFMNSMDFTMNTITMLALSLSIGLLIDDAIVVIENIFRHVEEGKSPREAAAFATNEIGLAVIAITMTIVAVFLPVAFMSGLVGRFFYQFGLTVTVAVLISLFVALTLTPMLSSRWLKESTASSHGIVFRLITRVLDGIDRAYETLLRTALRGRPVVVLIAVLVFAGSIYLSRGIRTEFIPVEDQSEFNIKVQAPLGASLRATDSILEEIRRRVEGQSWLDYTFATVGADELQRVNEGTLYVKMVDMGERSIHQTEAIESVRTLLADIRGAKVSVEVVPRVSGGGRGSADIQMEIRGPDLAQLEAITASIMEKMRASEGYVDVDTTYETGKPELNVYVNRDRAADLGVSPFAIASTVKALIGGNDVSKLRSEGDRYDVSVRLMEKYRDGPEDIAELTVRNDRGQLLALRNVASIREESAAVQIQHYSRTRQITVLANLEPDRKVLGEAIPEMTRFVAEAQLPAGYTYGFAGMADIMQEAFGALVSALLLAVLMVYMVLAAQFEDFVHPFTIMLSLPLAAVGALGALIVLSMTVSIFTMIGFIMLMGLVTKNAILLIDYTNTLRHRDGMERNAAVVDAGRTRLRPILMTTLAMVFGMLPIALGTGAGSESRAPMAAAVIGGLVASTLLTLVVVPVVYTYLDDVGHPATWRIWGLSRRWRRQTDASGNAN